MPNGIILADVQKRDKANVSLSSPTAKTGNYFRTESFVQDIQFTEDTEIKWMEAVESPVTNKWTLLEVAAEPNFSAQNDEDPKKLYRKKVSVQNASLDDALECLLKFEKTQEQLGYVRAKPLAKELKGKHVLRFALNEGRIPDMSGKVHPNVGGFAITEGCYDPEILAKAEDVIIHRAPERVFSLKDTNLSQMFTVEAEAEDFQRLLAQRIEKAKWKKIVNAAAHVLNGLIKIQNWRFNTSTKNSLMSKTVTIDGEKELKNSIENLEKLLKETSINGLEKVGERFKSFINEVNATYEVAYAKHLYHNTAWSDGVEEDVKNLKDQREYAEEILREMGATASDIKRMNAEIISDSGYQSLREYCYQNVAEQLGVDLDEMRHLIDRYDFRGGNDVIYFPANLLGFLQECDGITQQLEERIKQEKERITHVRKNAEEIAEDMQVAAGDHGTVKVANTP